MNAKSLRAAGILILSCLLSHAQTPGTNVLVTLTGSGSEWETFTYTDGRVDAVTNQVSVNLTLRPGAPQLDGVFFSSTNGNFSGSITIQVSASINDNGFVEHDNLDNQATYNDLGFTPDTLLFFGPQFQGANPGNLASLVMNLPTQPIQDPQPYQILYDGTNQTITVSISLPSPYAFDEDTCMIPCTAAVANNGSSFKGTVQDASTGHPIPNATVMIGGQSLATDASGAFSVPYLAPGPLTVQIRAPGYDTYEKTQPLPPFSAVVVTFSLKPSASHLSIVDANPMFLNSTVLPVQSINPSLWQTLAADAVARSGAAADGQTQLLLRFTNDAPGNVAFSILGDGQLTGVDNSVLADGGIHTIPLAGQQIAFALYTVPDQIPYPNDKVYFTASFTPDDLSLPGSTSLAVTTLNQTPVLLVHGLWANAETWQSMQNLLTGRQILSQKLNYYDNRLFAAGPFAAYAGLVNQGIRSMIAGLRGDGTAVTRADVVAHSMGGILTRIDANDPGVRGVDTYGQGYIRRVITVDTPHYGSSAAPILSLLATNVPFFDAALTWSKHPVTNGAVEDLSPLSFAINSGGSESGAYKPLALPSYAIAGEVGPSDNVSGAITTLYIGAYLAWGSLPFLNSQKYNLLTSLLCGQQFMSPDEHGMAQVIFNSQPNDSVVQVYSQEGNSQNFDIHAGVEHIDAPLDPIVQSEILDLLQGPVTALAPYGLPAVNKLALSTQVCPDFAEFRLPTKGGAPFKPRPPQPMTKLINLVGPSDGASVAPNSQISIAAQPLPGVSLQLVSFVASEDDPLSGENVTWDFVTNPPYADFITVPTNYFGSMTLSVVAVDTNGNYDAEQSVVEVLPSSNLTLESISIDLNSVQTNLTFSELATPQTIGVTGLYSDSATRNITLGSAGTSYETSNPRVAVADTNGSVTAVANGNAFIVVANNGLTSSVPVSVSLQPPQIISIVPDNVQPGTSNWVTIVGRNLGGASSVEFLRGGQTDTNLVVEAISPGIGGANIRAFVYAPASALPGVLTTVVRTPVASSATVLSNASQLFVGQPLAFGDFGFTNSGTAFHFVAFAPNGSALVIQSSPDLQNWMTVQSNSFVSAPVSFTDTNENASSRFYRVQLLSY